MVTDPLDSATVDESVSDFVAGRVESRLTSREGDHVYNWFDPRMPTIPPQAAPSASDMQVFTDVLARLRIKRLLGSEHPLIPEQQTVALAGLASRVQLLQGPPGTGKTQTTSAALLLRILARRKAGVPKRGKVPAVPGDTHFGGETEQGITEFELEEKVVELIESAPALVLAAFSPQDVDRVVTLYRAAQRTKRVFAADAYTAFVLHLVAGEAKIPRPTQDKGIRVYHNVAFRRRNIEKLMNLFGPNRIELDEILTAPRKHMMVFRPSMTALDFGGTLPDKSRVLYGYWPGYLKNPDWVDLQHATEVQGDFIRAHASGHIYIADLIELVNALNAKTVIPIHTFEPQRFSEHFANTEILRDGEEFQVP